MMLSTHVETVDVLPSPVQIGTDAVLARATIWLSLLPETLTFNSNIWYANMVISSLPAKGTGSWGGWAETHTSSTVSSVYPINDKRVG